MKIDFKEKAEALMDVHEELLNRPNEPLEGGNGIYTKYKYPIVTA